MAMALPTRRRVPTGMTQTPKTNTAAISSTPDHGVGVRRGAGLIEELWAVVAIVSVTGTVVIAEVNVTVLGLKLQMLFGGSDEHMEAERVAEPVKPFCELNVSAVDPDWPGLEIVITGWFAVIVNVCPTSTKLAGEVDPR
jgi:hypothetical protein